MYLRDNSILSYFPRTPVNVIYTVLNLWLLKDKNSNEITSYLKDNLINYDINNEKILDILTTTRYYIAYYYNHKYKLEDISEVSKNERFSVDENEFITIENTPL